MNSDLANLANETLCRIALALERQLEIMEQRNALLVEGAALSCEQYKASQEMIPKLIEQFKEIARAAAKEEIAEMLKASGLFRGRL